MSKLPSEIRLTDHAKMRLLERKSDENIYNTRNLMRSSVKWYTKDDLIPDEALYRHCCYTTRKSNQMGYITDGDIEVIYNKNTQIAITVLPVKEKFKPITQYIKPAVLTQIEIKKENRKMKKSKLGVCPDCGREDVEITSRGVCVICRRRQDNMKSRGKEYIPYLQLPESEKKRVDISQRAQAARKTKEETIMRMIEIPKTIPVVENYYQVKAENNPDIAQVTEKPIPHQTQKSLDPLSDQDSFVRILRECGCDIPEESLEDVLDVLLNTDKLKDIFMTIAKSTSQQAMLDLEQALNVVERKLQHDWEYNGFQEVDDIKFKGFLTWRRVLKGAIFFWKKLYQTNTIIEMQRAWNAYTQDPNDKILLAGDKIDSSMKRYQITTDSISTIFNTRRPFTRVFYATDKDVAYNIFKKWMADRNLHEDPKKTTIVELNNDSEDPRKEEK